jgi:hypothetical protein
MVVRRKQSTRTGGGRQRGFCHPDDRYPSDLAQRTKAGIAEKAQDDGVQILGMATVGVESCHGRRPNDSKFTVTAQVTR